MRKKDIHATYEKPTKEFHELKFPYFQIIHSKENYQILDLDMVEVSEPATPLLKQHGFSRVIHYAQEPDR